MNARSRGENKVAGVAAAIGEPARARMLYCLMGNLAKTSTELAMVADVSPSTASAHLSRLVAERLVRVQVQGKHRYYRLEGPEVAKVLEGLCVLARSAGATFAPSTPIRLRFARTCYDHLAGTLGVLLHDRLFALKWVCVPGDGESYELTAKGLRAAGDLGIDVSATRSLRRRFAYGCLDWSERRLHMGGAVGLAFLNLVLKKEWVSRDLDSRALSVTSRGRREMLACFGLQI